MSSQQLDEERIFHIAREIGNAETRFGYLDQVCAGDQSLRDRVEELLRVHEREQSFLKSNGDPLPTEAMGELNIASGQQIGRYKLLQKIGEGGFGVVFMAEQSRPVRRKVALKVIKPGMDNLSLLSSCESENGRKLCKPKVESDRTRESSFLGSDARRSRFIKRAI